MVEDLTVHQKSINDFIKGVAKTYHCEHCEIDLQFPINQDKGKICPFCKRDLVEGSCKKKVSEDETTEKHDKVKLLVFRDDNNKIVDIKEVDDETFEKVTSENHNENIDVEKTPKIEWTQVDGGKIYPLNELSNFENGIIVIVYKQQEFCGITNVIEKMIIPAIEKFKKSFDDDKKINVFYKSCIKNKESYINKKSNLYPQIAIFYKNNNDFYFIEHINIKDLDEDTIFNKFLYISTIAEKNYPTNN